jgi:predicted S18 family serine protease
MPINNWTINLVLGLILSIMVGGGIYVWKQSISTQALIEYKSQEYLKQLEQQKKVMEDTTAILKESTDIVADLKEKTIQMNEKVKNLESYLSTHKDDKESSEVLKRTFKELSQ